MKVRLSPHALTHYGSEWCQRCWWLKHRAELPPPGAPYPEVTRVADESMKMAFLGMDVSWLDIPGTVRPDKKTWVLSSPYEANGGQIEIGGFADAIVDLNDGTVGVIDYKMTNPKPSTADRYQTQLNAYAYAMENPIEGEPLEVSRLWLVCWSPGQLSVSPDLDNPQVFMGSITPIEVRRVHGSTEKIMDEHAKILFGSIPLPSGQCNLCGYMSRAAATVKRIKESEKAPMKVSA
jgi:hypothetical protein